MRKTTDREVNRIKPDAEQPRKHFGEAELLALGQNMLAHGQQLPVILYADGEGFTLLDGERRWRAAQLVGMKTLAAIELTEKPTAAALHVLQMSIEAHKVGHSVMERSDCLARIRQELGCSVSELAGQVHIGQSVCSKLLGLQKLAPEVQKLLHLGKLDIEKAYIISQTDDFGKQRELLQGAVAMSRDQLRQRTKNNGKPEVKASAARFAMPGGMMICLQGKEVTLSTAIEVLQETVKRLKKAQGQHLTIESVQRVLKDQAKANR